MTDPLPSKGTTKDQVFEPCYCQRCDGKLPAPCVYRRIPPPPMRVVRDGVPGYVAILLVVAALLVGWVLS